jgi:hypothetical protein
MKKYLLIALVAVLFGCKKENFEEVEIKEGSVMLKPFPVALIGNNVVKLTWYNNAYLEKYYFPYEVVEPDRFEIYISRNNYPNFTKLVEIYNTKRYSYTIPLLENNKPVYFYVTSLKKGFDKLISDTIMVIPNREIPPVDLAVQNNNHTIYEIAGYKYNF